MEEATWAGGDEILLRQVLRGARVWLVTPVRVVRDEPGLIALYLAEGTGFEFPDVGVTHPWADREAWSGHGVLMLHRPDDPYAIWHFWEGTERDFAGWYVNFQEPLRRTEVGFDTLDQELDIWIPSAGPWEWKDVELLEERVREGRFTPAEAAEIRANGDAMAAELDAGRRWWDESWSRWEPDAAW